MTYSHKTEKSPNILRVFFNMAAEAHLFGGEKFSVVNLDAKGND
jgi:hypothetical protein